MHKRKTILLLFILIIFVSCATNKIVHLKPKDPYVIEENGMTFSISETQEYWIYFDPDKWASGFTMFFNTDVMPEFVNIKSLTMDINELDISIQKKGLNKEIILKDREFDTLKKYWAHEDFNNVIFTSDIINSYTHKYGKKLTSIQMFNEFEKINEVSFIVDIEYSIDGNIYNSSIKFSYDTRNVTSSRFWDTLMSV